MVKDFRLLKLNEDKVMNLILRVLYTNIAKFEFIHEPLSLKLLQLFHQTIFSRRCFQKRTSHRNYLANLTWYNVLSQEHDSFLQKTENLEEFKYALAFTKLLLT